MGFGKLTLIAILSYAGAATAFPRVNNVAPAAAKEPCMAQKAVVETNTSDIAALRDQMRQLAAVSQNDTSVPLKKFKPKNLPRINAQEQIALNKAVGRCSCSVEINGVTNDNASDCTIAGVSGTNSIAVGVEHLIEEVVGPDKSVPPSLRCEFANNFGDAPVPLVFERGSYKLGKSNTSDTANDRMIIRLKSPIPDAKEIPILPSGVEVAAGSSVYAFSVGLQSRMKTKELVAQECAVIDGAPNAFSTNCTSVKGLTSGMPVVARDQQGRLVLVGVSARGSTAKKDGQPAVITNGDGTVKGNNLTFTVGMGSEAVRDLLSVEGQVGRKMVQAASATTGL